MDPQLALHLDATRPDLPLDDLDQEEVAVARELRWGRASARQVPEIAAAAGLPVRRTQSVVRRLIEEHWWPIGTSMTAPHGNYLIDDATDLESTERLLREHGISTLMRAAALRRMSLRRYLQAVQTELMEGEKRCA